MLHVNIYLNIEISLSQVQLVAEKRTWHVPLVWKQISPEDQEIILEAAHNSTEAHKVMWDTAIEEAVKEAQETMGVEFVYDVDKEAFREATQPMIEAYEEQYPGVKTLMDTIEAAREGE